MRKLLTRIRRLLRANDGTAAIEFALVLPVLATIVICMPDVSQAVTGVLEMEGAARASIQYAMAGGTDMSAAQNIGMASWTTKPANATLAASEACLCGSAGGTCGQVCPDGTNPQTYFTVVASGMMGGSTINFQKSISRSVRVQ